MKFFMFTVKVFIFSFILSLLIDSGHFGNFNFTNDFGSWTDSAISFQNKNLKNLQVDTQSNINTQEAFTVFSAVGFVIDVINRAVNTPSMVFAILGFPWQITKLIFGLSWLMLIVGVVDVFRGTGGIES